MRIYFRFERRLLGELCRVAWDVVRQVYAAASGQPEAVPGMIGAIQTFGDLVHRHPHIHALVSEGVFLPEGTFVPVPKLATEPFLRHCGLWEETSDPYAADGSRDGGSLKQFERGQNRGGRFRRVARRAKPQRVRQDVAHSFEALALSP